MRDKNDNVKHNLICINVNFETLTNAQFYYNVIQELQDS